jgi:hypothetical protein
MDPKIQLSPEVIKHFNELKTTLEQWLATHKEIPSDDVLAQELSVQKEKYLTLLNDVTTTLSKVSAKTKESVDPNTIAQRYEMAVELGIQMGTGGNVILAANYQSALNAFFSTYTLGNEELQTEWLEAKKELEKSDLIIKEKIRLAVAEAAKRRASTPSGGYFRFIEGKKGNETYYRLDWLSKMTHLKGEAYHVDNDPDNDKYTAGTNQYLIEVYQANIDDVGAITFTRNGTAYSFNSKGLELFNMLKKPYLTIEETGNKKFPALKHNEKPKNTAKSQWSVSLWTPDSKVAEVIELPDWNDHGFKALYKEFKTKCASLRLSKDQATNLKEQMTTAIAQQKKLYRMLNIIHKELAAREDDKLVQQKEEVITLLKIWRKRIQTYEPLIAPLDYKDCLRPPVVVDIAMGYWTADVSDPKQAVKDLEKAGILDRLRAYPNAVVQITATFEYGSSYISDPTVYMGTTYSASVRKANSIPASINTRRSFLSVKAQNVTNLIVAQVGITSKQVTPNLTPGDTGDHMGSGDPFGKRVIITWINDGE